MFIEILIYISLLLLALAVLVWKRSGVDGAALTAIGILGLAVCGALLWKPETDLQLELALPAGLEPEAGLATSDSCRACHPDQYRSWHRSYHRTMTQAATPEAVLAPFEGVRLVDGQGEPTLLTREGNGFWVEMKPFWQLEPGRGDVSSQMAGLPRVRQRIVMTTGHTTCRPTGCNWRTTEALTFSFPGSTRSANDAGFPLPILSSSLLCRGFPRHQSGIRPVSTATP